MQRGQGFAQHRQLRREDAAHVDARCHRGQRRAPAREEPAENREPAPLLLIVVLAAGECARSRQRERAEPRLEKRVVVVAPADPHHAAARRRLAHRLREDPRHAVHDEQVCIGHVGAHQAEAKAPGFAEGDVRRVRHEALACPAFARDDVAIEPGERLLEQRQHQRHELLVPGQVDDPHAAGATSSSACSRLLATRSLSTPIHSGRRSSRSDRSSVCRMSLPTRPKRRPAGDECSGT